jgi:hypothetical protein
MVKVRGVTRLPTSRKKKKEKTKSEQGNTKNQEYQRSTIRNFQLKNIFD